MLWLYAYQLRLLLLVKTMLLLTCEPERASFTPVKMVCGILIKVYLFLSAFESVHANVGLFFAYTVCCLLLKIFYEIN